MGRSLEANSRVALWEIVKISKACDRCLLSRNIEGLRMSHIYSLRTQGYVIPVFNKGGARRFQKLESTKVTISFTAPYGARAIQR